MSRELEKISVQGDDLYLPTATNKIVRGIQLDSGIPLQSAAKVPIMITFNVVDKDGDPNDVKPQACIFKVFPCVILSPCCRPEPHEKNVMMCPGILYLTGWR